MTVGPRFIAMIDLNRASVDDIARTGIAVELAREVVFWGPFRAWEDLLWLAGVDDRVLTKLTASGFQIGPSQDADWPAPKPFRLSANPATHRTA